jgi:26S proteasome regulatory subunit N5
MIVDEEVKNVDLIQMLEEEKRARINNETTKQAPLLIEILKFYFKKNDYDGLRSQLANLSKKRNQSKNAITEMVGFALNKVYDGLSDEDQRIKLLNTLVEITEGKIFVEV